MTAPADFADDRALAVRAAHAAGAVVLRYFGRDTPVEYKAPDQPVTAADLEADRLLRHELTTARPSYGWLSEESSDAPERLERERVWIVDPIDGTRSFLQGRAEYAISIGLAVAGQAVVGVVLNPSTGELYEAVRGGGSWRNGEPIRVAAVARGRPSLLASRSELRRGEFDALRDDWQIRPLGSTAYKLVKVAEGSGDAYLSRGPKSEWDVCAAALIVEEAGGRATDLAGAQPQYNRPAPFLRGIVAAGSKPHAALLHHLAVLAAREPG